MSKETITPTELETALDSFTGTTQWYRHSLFRSFLYTDGVKYLAENAGAYWLLDLICGFQYEFAKMKTQEFQVWKLSVSEDNTAILVCQDGNYRTIHEHELEFTDFPLKEVEVWLSGSVLYLPSEH